MLDSDNDDLDCPLCMEELDIADRNFRPCTCGYQICRFCWHHIKENLNGRCPACRREYSDQMVEFQPVSSEELVRIKREKKEKERHQKDMEMANRRHLANMRVVQKNLVYIIGLHPKLASEDIIRSTDYFGQFGKIAKVVINKRPAAPTSNASGTTTMQPSAAVYVTYQRKEDAAKAIHGVDGTVMCGRIIRASYGTTKYCTYYLRNMTCPNPTCLYLHEPGEEADTISKEELATGKHRMRDQMSKDSEQRNHSLGLHPSCSSTDAVSSSRKPATLESVATILYKNSRQESFPPIPKAGSAGPSEASQTADDGRPALPSTASWAKASSGPSTPVMKSAVPERSLTADNFGPPLSVAVAAAQKQQQLGITAKRKLEKKKREESLQESLEKNQANSVESPAAHHDDSLDSQRAAEDDSQDAVSMNTQNRHPYFNDGLIRFVFGDAQYDACSLPLSKPDEKESMPVGVTALYDSMDEIAYSSNTAARYAHVDEYVPAEHVMNMSPLDFLTCTATTHVYPGSFNPFAHQILRSTGALFEAPMRKCSRFGFAQI